MSRIQRIVRPLFFEETITAENYRNVLTQLIALLQQNELDCWFQQQEATAHTEDTAAAFLQDLVCDRIV